MAELADALDLGSSVTHVQVQVLSPAPTKNALLSTKTKVRFLNDVCLRQMMLVSPMMTATPNDAWLATIYGKHRIIANDMSNIIMRSITSYRASDISLKNATIYDIINSPINKNLTKRVYNNEAFMEKQIRRL